MLELTLDEAIKHCKENVQKETQNGNLQCAAEHNQLAIWLSQLEESTSKAAAYDRLMSGGKKTLKELANFLGRVVAVDANGNVESFAEEPRIDLHYGFWYLDEDDEDYDGFEYFIPPDLIDFTGNWRDSLTLPDGWEES
jgi:hypothetical protein